MLLVLIPSCCSRGPSKALPEILVWFLINVYWLGKAKSPGQYHNRCLIQYLPLKGNPFLQGCMYLSSCGGCSGKHQHLPVLDPPPPPRNEKQAPNRKAAVHLCWVLFGEPGRLLCISFLPESMGIIPTVTERAKFLSCDAQAHGALVWALRADVSQVCLRVRCPVGCADGQQLLTTVYCTQSGCLEGSGYN